MRLRAAWLYERDQSLLRKLALLPLEPLSWLYAAAAWSQRKSYRSGLRRRSRYPGRVVSVGNLTVGGTGKTPLAAWLAKGLRRRGHRVALVSRGYGGHARDAVTLVSDGHYLRSNLAEAGDEAMLLAAHAPGVPVLVGRDRTLVGLRAASVFGADVLVLDDGFQHGRLHRDVDLVAFDGNLGLGSRRVLPRGPLREPAGALAAAHVIGVVDGPLPPADASRIDQLARGALRFEARRVPRSLRSLDGGAALALGSLAGSDVGLFAGIANPAGFRRSVEALGARVVAERWFPDHHHYRREDLRGLAAKAPRWLTTEKDAVKLVPWWRGRAAVEVLGIGIEVAEGDRLLDDIDRLLR